MDSLRICLAQMTSGQTHDCNIEALGILSRTAADRGCDLLALPEVAGLMDQNRKSLLQKICNEDDDPFINACKHHAGEHQLWIHLGSTPVRGPDKLYNRSLLIDDMGVVRARYDKIHLFDYFPEDRAPIQESATYHAGRQAVLSHTPWGLWGLTICYDLRFPHLFASYVVNGAHVLFVPSAFTVGTGRDHWEVLLRARAIETGCWIIAAAQAGHHEDGRKTYGHAMILDPAGTVIMDLGGNGASHGIQPLTGS